MAQMSSSSSTSACSASLYGSGPPSSATSGALREPCVAKTLETEPVGPFAPSAIANMSGSASHSISSSLGGSALVELGTVALPSATGDARSLDTESSAPTAKGSSTSGEGFGRGEKAWAPWTTKLFSWLNGAKALDHGVSFCVADDGC